MVTRKQIDKLIFKYYNLKDRAISYADQIEALGIDLESENWKYNHPGDVYITIDEIVGNLENEPYKPKEEAEK